VTPTEYIYEHFIVPFELYPFQACGVDGLAPLPRTGIYWEPGLGKTPGSTFCSLYHKINGADVIVGITPPSLVRQWSRWLSRIKHKSGKPLDVLMYQGPPAKRRLMDLNVEIVLMSIQIFKRDYTRICEELGVKNVHIFVDEAHCLKDVSTQNYKMVRDFSAEQTIQLLTGTPLSNPCDVYAYVKFTAPMVYSTLYQFEQIHVAERDFRDTPIEFQNMDLLQSNLLINADRKTKHEVLTQLPEAIITQIDYDLDPKHYSLYKRLAEDQLLLLPDGDKRRRQDRRHPGHGPVPCLGPDRLPVAPLRPGREPEVCLLWPDRGHPR